MLLNGIVGRDISLSEINSNIIDRNITEFDLQSDGGDLYEGFAIYDKLKGNIDTINCFGLVASAATIILASAKNRIGSENSRFLIHPPRVITEGDSNDFLKVSQELSKEYDSIIDIYSNILNIDKIAIKNLMNENRVIHAEEALQIGLLTKIINKNMENKNDEKLNLLDKFFSKIENLFKTKPVNLIKQDVNGVELDFGTEIDTAEKITVGTTATVNGQPAQGEFVLADGTVYVFEKGSLMEIKTAEIETKADPETEKLKAENEAQKVEIANLKNELTKIKNEKTESDSKLNLISKEFEKIKNEFPKLNMANVNTPESKTENTKQVSDFTRKKK